MLDKSQAAKYLVVAWVKDWTMRTLLDAIDGIGTVEQERLDRVAAALPFMPTHAHWYVASKGAGVSARHFVADAFPRLSDALWDAKDHEARLKLAPQIERLSAVDVKPTSRFSQAERYERRLADKEARQERTLYRLSREAFKTNQRSAWNVCKA